MNDAGTEVNATIISEEEAYAACCDKAVLYDSGKGTGCKTCDKNIRKGKYPLVSVGTDGNFIYLKSR